MSTILFKGEGNGSDHGNESGGNGKTSDANQNPKPSTNTTTTTTTTTNFNLNCLHLAHLSSTPLVRRDQNGERRPLEMLDVKEEKKLLLRSLKEAGRRVRVRFDTATSDNLRKMVTLGTRALHYSGHGLQDELVFEDKYGAHHGLDVNQLRELLAAGGGASSIQFAFVSACHSQSAGEAFAAAGVNHVVAVKRNKRVSDNASVKFSEQFYLALLMGRTVQESFDIGLATLAASADQRTRADAEHMFMLLPVNVDHNVPIFHDLEMVDSNDKSVVIDTSPKRAINNMDKPPTLFAGRNLETQQVYELLMHQSVNRCITIHGPPGIGKTAVASKVCEYVTDHRSFDAVYMVRLSQSNGRIGDMGESRGKSEVENPEDFNGSNSDSSSDRTNEPIHYLKLFWESVDGCSSGGNKGGGSTKQSNNEGDFLSYLESLNMRILLVLDGVQEVRELSSLRRFIDKMLTTVDDISLLCTSTGRDIIGGENLHGNVEKLVPLKGIDRWNSARLLMARCPRKMSIRELGEGAKISNALEIMSNHPSITGLIGNPRAIEMAAPLLRDIEINQLTEHIPEILRNIIGDTLSFSSGAVKSSVEKDVTKKSSSILSDLRTTQPKAARMWFNAGGNDHAALWGNMKHAIIESYNSSLPRMTCQLRPLTNLELEYMYNNKLACIAGGLNGAAGAAGGKEAASVTLNKFLSFYSWWKGVLQIIAAVQDLWCKNNPVKIDGFLSREQAELKLKQCVVGTFIIRFSLSKTSNLAISWVNSMNEENVRKIQHFLVERRSSGFVIAFPTGAVMYLSLEKLVHNLKKLEYLYPRMHKDLAFDVRK